MIKLDKFYIGGKFVNPIDSKKTISIIDPSNEKEIGIVSLGNINDVNFAVETAKKAFKTSIKLRKNQKIELLKNFYENYKKRFNEIADAIRTEMGAPSNLAKGAQTAVGLGHIKTAIEVLEKKEFEYKHNQFLIREEPIGVCGLITPWNWPINQIVSKVAPAIAAGCTVILKPSEIAPLSAMIIAEIIDKSGLPDGMFNLINGEGNVVGEAMSAHKDIDMMSFTGSTRGGISVASTGAKTVKRISQELGGKSPNIIIDDDKFNESVSNGVNFVMSNSGQSCNAPTRMLIPVERYDEAIEIAKDTASKLKVGDPNESDTDLGPLVSETQFKKVQNLIKNGINDGAYVVTGGLGKPQNLDKGYYVKPTVFSNVKNDMEIAREEIFGPVLSIISYSDIEDAIEIANDTDYGLAAYVSGDNQQKNIEIANQLRAGQISINYKSYGPSVPFGGFKQSGNGREKAEWGLSEFLETKAIMF